MKSPKKPKMSPEFRKRIYDQLDNLLSTGGVDSDRLFSYSKTKGKAPKQLDGLLDIKYYDPNGPAPF